MPDPLDALELERVYAAYLSSCERSGIEPIPRQRALELLQEWMDALSSPAEPTATDSSSEAGSFHWHRAADCISGPARWSEGKALCGYQTDGGFIAMR